MMQFLKAVHVSRHDTRKLHGEVASEYDMIAK